jgi:hypothetical protein
VVGDGYRSTGKRICRLRQPCELTELRDRAFGEESVKELLIVLVKMFAIKELE